MQRLTLTHLMLSPSSHYAQLIYTPGQHWRLQFWEKLLDCFMHFDLVQQEAGAKVWWLWSHSLSVALSKIWEKYNIWKVTAEDGEEFL